VTLPPYEGFPLPSASRAVPTHSLHYGRRGNTDGTSSVAARTSSAPSSRMGTASVAIQHIPSPKPPLNLQTVPYNIVRGKHLGLPLSRTQPPPQPRYQSVRGLPYTQNISFVILSAQERAVRGTHLGLSLTQAEPLPVRTEEALPNCTAVDYSF